NFTGPGVVQVRRFVQLAPTGTTDPRFDQTCSTPDTTSSTMGGTKSFACDFLGGTPGSPGTTVAGETVDWASYLRDSWQPISNVILNAGVRYEEQQLRYAAALRNTTDPLTGNHIGTTAMSLDGNWAPRLGAIWDPTGEGRSKLWVSYGRFYESIP